MSKTISFDLEILQPGQDEFHFCLHLYGKDIMADAGAQLFMVRSKETGHVLGSCGYHLESITVMRDTIQAELDRAKQEE